MTFYCDLEQKVVRENLNPEQFLVTRHYLVLAFNGTRVDMAAKIGLDIEIPRLPMAPFYVDLTEPAIPDIL